MLGLKKCWPNVLALWAAGAFSPPQSLTWENMVIHTLDDSESKLQRVNTGQNNNAQFWGGVQKTFSRIEPRRKPAAMKQLCHSTHLPARISSPLGILLYPLSLYISPLYCSLVNIRIPAAPYSTSPLHSQHGGSSFKKCSNRHCAAHKSLQLHSS